MTSTRKQRVRSFSFRELTIWKTELPKVKFGVLPPSNNRPNPLAAKSRLFASVFAPGAICALDLENGKLIWRRELPKYANASVSLYGKRLFAGTPNTLFVLHPDSGETLWSFCPYGSAGESIYSSPSLLEDRAYIGDRRGFLHCLDVENGKTIWKRRTNRAHNNDVNSTPVLLDGLVIVSTNAKTAVAYEAVSGKLAWQQHLDSPSTFGPLMHGDSIMAVADSLYLLNPRTGKVRRRYSWNGLKAQQAESTPKGIILTFWPKLSKTKLPPDKAEAEKIAAQERQSTSFAVIANSGKKRIKSIDVFCPSFRYEPTTQLVYLSHLHGVDVLRPTTGALLCRLKVGNDTRGGIALPDANVDCIYVLSGDGTVYALRIPSILRR